MWEGLIASAVSSAWGVQKYNVSPATFCSPLGHPSNSLMLFHRSLGQCSYVRVAPMNQRSTKHSSDRKFIYSTQYFIHTAIQLVTVFFFDLPEPSPLFIR